MKTKMIKMGLPGMAFLIAIALAFATDSKASEKEALITGYIFQNGHCVQAPKDCNQIGALTCSYLGFQVFQNKISDTSCSVPMTHRP